MGSSAQNSSGVHWCSRRVRFNEVPKKVPRVPGEGLGGFGAEPGHIQQGSREGSGEGLGGFGAQVQLGSGEGSAEGLGGFGAEPGQVQQVQTQLRCFQRLASQHASESFVKIKHCGCLGYGFV